MNRPYHHNARTVLCLLLISACGGNEDPTGLGEPLVLSGDNVSFRQAPLPANLDPAAPASLPRITLVETNRAIYTAGVGGRALSGRTTVNAVAIALALKGLSSGHWLLPVGVPDPTANNELTWEFGLAFDRSVAPGRHVIQLAALGADGAPGAITEFGICVASPIPDNLNACEPSIAPPAAVLSLAWDTGMDLDLVVTTPDGRRITPDAPSGAGGVIQQDAQRQCHSEGLRRENLVWQAAPPSGTYLVYVNVFDACRYDVAHFSATLHQATPQGDGTQRLAPTWQQAGLVLPIAANGGAGPGLYVGALTF